MRDMYAAIRNADKRKPQKESLKIIIPTVIIILIAIGVAISLPLIYRYYIHPRFTVSLMKSEYYAYENDCMIAQIDGQTIHVGKDNIGAVCVRLIMYSPEQLGFITPKREPDLILDFGDGSILRLWEDTIFGREKGKAVRFIFEGADGSRYHFLNDNFSFYDISVPTRSFQKGNTVLD